MEGKERKNFHLVSCLIGYKRIFVFMNCKCNSLRNKEKFERLQIFYIEKERAIGNISFLDIERVAFEGIQKKL